MNFNLDVNAIIDQIAAGLGVAADTVISIYPQLVNEIIRYEFFGTMCSLFMTFSIIFIFMTFGYAFFGWLECDRLLKRILIPLIGADILFIVMTIGMYAMQLFSAPNVTLFMKILKLE